MEKGVKMLEILLNIKSPRQIRVAGPAEPKGQGGRLPPQFLEKFAIFSSNLPL